MTMCETTLSPLVPDETDSELAATASRALARATTTPSPSQEDGSELTLPKALHRC